MRFGVAVENRLRIGDFKEAPCKYHVVRGSTGGVVYMLQVVTQRSVVGAEEGVSATRYRNVHDASDWC